MNTMTLNLKIWRQPEAVCPKEIPIANIARMSREYTRTILRRG